MTPDEMTRFLTRDVKGDVRNDLRKAIKRQKEKELFDKWEKEFKPPEVTKVEKEEPIEVLQDWTYDLNAEVFENKNGVYTKEKATTFDYEFNIGL